MHRSPVRHSGEASDEAEISRFLSEERQKMMPASVRRLRLALEVDFARIVIEV